MRPAQIVQSIGGAGAGGNGPSKTAGQLQKFARAAGECGLQAKTYGACVLASYETVEKGMCEREFVAFKACVQEQLQRKW